MIRTFFSLIILVGCCMLPCAEAADSCTECHSNHRKMDALGYGHFSMTQQEVEAQTRMPASCTQCHLGDPEAPTKDAAHKEMARLLVVSRKGLSVKTTERIYPLEYGANQANRVYTVINKDGVPVKDISVAALSWHDKNPQTLSQDFGVMQKTCGACHKKEFAEFSKSTMATNAKQSRYKGWTDTKTGPHNCGTWFEGNFDVIQANSSIPLSPESNRINQKVCNTCHVGCLDCHFLPQKKNPADPSKGAHSFVKTPPPESCYGGGRASICHAGPEDRRRGAGYFGGSFSFPEGNPPDVHLRANVGCLDCHESTRSNPAIGHGTVRRQAQGSCKGCHAVAVKSHATSRHKRLSCEACHIRNVAGYQATYWGPGKLAGAATPYFKFKAYYGYLPEPILIRDQKGRWIPVKPFPMAVMNQKGSPFKPGLYWRYPADIPDLQRTDDAWAYVGISGALPENNQAILWIQMDKMSHKLGKSRTCDSCHAAVDGSQHQSVTWEYSDPGAFPFSGSHEILADKSGLYIRKMRSEKIELEDGFTLSALAPWVYLPDAWQVKGDFSVPLIRDRKEFESVRNSNSAARKADLVHH